MSLDLDRVRALWDDNADAWARGVRDGADVYRDHYNNPAFFSLLGEVRGAHVLDAGCGEGTNTRRVAELGARVVGLDVSERLIAYARNAETERPLGIEYVVGSMTDLVGLEDASFDLVVSTMALMDTPDFASAMRAFARVLKPSGRLVFSITHPCFTNAIAGWDDDVLRIAGYAGVDAVIETWRFRAGPTDAAPFRIAYFPRTLSEIVRAMVAAGFGLTALEEPLASDEACERFPSMRKHRSIPHFLHVAAALT